MTEQQKAALASADAKMAPANELYAERNKLAFLYYKLDLRDLRRLNQLLRKLTDAELRMVARFAEGLAEWSDSAQESSDGPPTGG